MVFSISLVRRKLFVRSILFALTYFIAHSSVSTSTANGQIGRIDKIIQTGDQPPNGRGSIVGFNRFRLNDQGQVVFRVSAMQNTGNTDDTAGIFLWTNGQLSRVVRAGESGPNGVGVVQRTERPSIDKAGNVTYLTSSTTPSSPRLTRALFRSSTGLIIQSSDSALDGNGVVENILDPFTGSGGDVVFRVEHTNTANGLFDNEGVYLSTSNGLVQLAREGDVSADGIGRYVSFQPPSVNDSGQVAFIASYSHVSNRALLIGDTNGARVLVRNNESVPNGVGTFRGFSNPTISNGGSVAFRARLENTGEFFSQGIYLGNFDEIVELARVGDLIGSGPQRFTEFLEPTLDDQDRVFVTAFGTNDTHGLFRITSQETTPILLLGNDAPNGNGQLFRLNDYHINRNGLVAYSAELTNTMAGDDDDRAIYLTDGQETLLVAQKGDTLNGRVSADIRIETGFATGDDGHRNQKVVNQHGQVLFSGNFGSGDNGEFLFTPKLKWRNAGDGRWDTNSNWTLGLEPAHVHDIEIASDNNITLLGPENDVSIASLTLGGGQGTTTLELEGSSLIVSDSLSVKENGILAGTGSVVGDAFINGRLSPGIPVGELRFGGDVTTSADSILDFEIAALADFDQIIIDGDLELDGNLEVNLINGLELQPGQEFIIIQVAGESVGSFRDLAEGEIVGNYGGNDLFISYSAGDGNDISLLTVPEPGNILALALLLLFGIRVRNRKSNSANS